MRRIEIVKNKVQDIQAANHQNMPQIARAALLVVFYDEMVQDMRNVVRRHGDKHQRKQNRDCNAVIYQENGRISQRRCHYPIPHYQRRKRPDDKKVPMPRPIFAKRLQRKRHGDIAQQTKQQRQVILRLYQLQIV